jgi:hypothetical protein
MKYLARTFTLPAGSNKISQKQWEKIFGKKKPRKKKGTK